MSGYVVANYSDEPGGLSSYLSSVMPTLQAHGAKILVAGPGHEMAEGKPGEVVGVLQFGSKEAARARCDSDEYRAIMHHRTDHSEAGCLAICDEFTPA